ncbi:hypothetical protein NC651_038800 [Populus alba x Populus x berolinensis]|nr:hypothetical protein NC651_038800 [Populus alba x Populus x berolinensis]
MRKATAEIETFRRRERLFRPQRREGGCGHVHREDSGTNARSYGSLSKSLQTIFSTWVGSPLTIVDCHSAIIINI